MASKESFYQRLKLAWLFLRKKGYMSVKCCEYCGSTNIKKISGHSDKRYLRGGNQYGCYKGYFVCMKCGATGTTKEKWVKDIKDKVE